MHGTVAMRICLCTRTPKQWKPFGTVRGSTGFVWCSVCQAGCPKKRQSLDITLLEVTGPANCGWWLGFGERFNQQAVSEQAMWGTVNADCLSNLLRKIKAEYTYQPLTSKINALPSSPPSPHPCSYFYLTLEISGISSLICLRWNVSWKICLASD